MKEDDPVSPNLNIFVAAFTTCLARLHLYETLDRLGERVLYMDTDSVIFTAMPGQWMPFLGSYLGEFKSELHAKDWIIEFATAGPKNYGYRTHGVHDPDPEKVQAPVIECKVRGFTLNSKGLEQLNFEVLRNNVLEEIEEPLKEPREKTIRKPYHIVRDAKRYELSTKEQTKKNKIVYDKRVVDPETYKTYPYGFRRY